MVDDIKIKKYKKRVVDEKIKEYLRLFVVICIECSKYSRKTWAERYHANRETLFHVKTWEK